MYYNGETIQGKHRVYKGALATVLTFEGPSFETARHIILQLCMHMQKRMHVN